MGMIWSMQQSPGQRPGLRLFKWDVTVPQDITFTAHEGHFSLDEIYRIQPRIAASTSIQRLYMGPGVRRILVKTGNIRGALFIPKGISKSDVFPTCAWCLKCRGVLRSSGIFVRWFVVKRIILPLVVNYSLLIRL